MSEFNRRSGEDFDTYALRLYDNKIEYGLDCKEIATILNSHSDTNKDESAWRKYYKAFREGVEYASKLSNTGVVTRILSISDCHVPFQLSLDKLADFRGKVDILQLNGDIGDCQAISKYAKVYRKSPMEEIIETRQFIIDLIEYIKIMGNIFLLNK